VKDETEYSTPWKAVNITAKIIVNTKPYKDPLLFPCINEWWAYVTVTPDDNKITVFNNGNSKGFIASIPIGGHIAPNSTVGESALWKNVQNIATKNKASDTINNATPRLSPLCTAKVWFPMYVPSDIISLNHNDIDDINVNRANIKKYSALLNEWKDKTLEVVSVNKLILVYMGQGEGETRWKGWAWKLLLCKFNIICCIFSQ